MSIFCYISIEQWVFLLISTEQESFKKKANDTRFLQFIWHYLIRFSIYVSAGSYTRIKIYTFNLDFLSVDDGDFCIKLFMMFVLWTLH